MKKLKAITVEFDSYEDLPALLLSRQLYTRSLNRVVTGAEKLELNRMLAKRLMMVRDESIYSETYQKIVEFSNFL
jgi:hypothetical protein